jgi:hypothetical protein
MTVLFRAYELAGPAITLPAAFVAWTAISGSKAYAIFAIAIPVVHAFVVPYVGTQKLRMWRIKSPFAPNGFRWHHGLLFGGATALIGALVNWAVWSTVSDSLFVSAFAFGIVLLAVNWLYDVAALRSGILEVYNQPWSEGKGPWIISADYVFWFFGAFGMIYGAGLYYATQLIQAPLALFVLAIAVGTSASLVPTALYVIVSYLRFGHSGCRPVTRVMNNVTVQ